MGISTATSTHARSRGVRASRHPHLPHPKASQTPAGEFARSTTRARPHHLTRRGPKGRAKSRGPEGTQGAPRKMRRQCAATPRACCPQPSLAAAAASLALSKTPAVLTSTRHASETTAAPGGCGGLTNPGAAETPRARAPSSSSRPRAPSLCENLFSNHKVPQRHPNRPCGSREQVRAKAEGPGVFKKDYRGSAPRFRPTRAHSTLEHTGAAAAGFKQTTESSAVVEADGDEGKYLRICLLSSSPGRVRGTRPLV